MISVQSLVNGLEAWVQEELLARRRFLALLDEQEAAVKKADGPALERSIAAIETELEAQARRDEKRARIFDALGEHWGVAGNALTLTSICERAGAAAARLPQLRDELGAAAERITRKNRRVSSLLNAHQKVIEELLQALVAIQGGRTESTTGALVDAEA
ncbi:MAG: flagellar export chaperone FlgN [Planctomycetes bacterium]|nr:flagellar export chaperone FlgN [Planctomycetota bacterium]